MALFAFCLKAIDRGCLFQRQANIIQPIQQALAAERVKLKADCGPVRTADRLGNQINGQFRVFRIGRIRQQGIAFICADLDRQNPVLKQLL